MGFEHYFQLHTHDGPSINSSGLVRFDSLARLEFFLLLIKPRRNEGNEKKMKNLLSLRPPLQYGPHGMNRIVCRSPQYYYRIFCVPSSVCKQKGTPAGSLLRAGRQRHNYIIPRLLRRSTTPSIRSDNKLRNFNSGAVPVGRLAVLLVRSQWREGRVVILKRRHRRQGW